MKNRVALLLLWLIVYCSFTLFTPALLDDADSVHAEVAREMLVRHDWVTLYANGIRYLEKAPFYYWSMAASFKALGVSTAASRLPLALSVLLLALTLESFARRTWSRRAGFYAGLITLSSFGIFIFSRINIPDVLVCCWLTLALWAFQRTEGQAEPRRSLCWTFAVACALNLLTKGLIGIVFPLGIVLVYLVAARGLRPACARLRRYHPISSLIVFFTLAVPWHILAALANPTQGRPGGLSYTGGHFSVPLPTDGNVHGWAWFYFVNEQLLRYMNLRVPRDYDTVPLWLFLGLVSVWLMPWSVFLPRALAEALPLRNRPFLARLRSRTLTRQERTMLLMLIWCLLPLAFFSLSTRQEYYVLPSIPPMVLLVAHSLERRGRPRRVLEGEAKNSALDNVESWALLVVGVLAAGFSVFFLIRVKAPAASVDLSTLLQQHPADYALSFGHFLDLNARSLGMFRVCLWLVLASVFGGTLVHFVLWHRRRRHDALLALGAAAFVFLFAAWKALVIFSPTLTSEELARAIAPQLRPGDLVALHGEYEAGSTLGFYLRRSDVHLVEGRSSNLWYGSFFADAPRIFESRESMAERWPAQQRIFLWQDPSDLDRPPLKLPGPSFVIAHSGGKEILSNQPNR